MDTNDFLGSFAQENVSFQVKVVNPKNVQVGQNYWTVACYIESDRFVDTTVAGWENAPGLDTCKVLAVNADTYAEYTTGLLQSWLYDLFCNGFTGNCILIAPAAKQETPASEDDFQVAMEQAFDVLKPYAYHVTVCAGGDAEIFAPYAVALAKKAMAEDYLTGAPMLPQTDATLAAGLQPTLKVANADAFMGWHSDSTRNGALYSLGLALAVNNASGTPIGNSMDMTASNNITASNSGVNPTAAQKTLLKGAYVQYFKTIGDNTGNVAAETDKTIFGKTYAAYWIRAYIIYMCKVNIARMITQRNFYKNVRNYEEMVAYMKMVVNAFKGAGLKNIVFSAPDFSNLPEAADDEIIVPNAWSATYENHLRKVSITGTLYIGD